MSPSSNDERSGIKTAIALAADAANAAPAERAEQLPLLPLKPSGAELDDGVGEERAPRKPGRPPGARNKSTEEWRDYLLTRYTSPLIAAAELYSRNLEQLAADLGYKLENLKFEQRVELLKIQRDAALGLAPYLHSKQPLAVHVDQRGVVQVIVTQDDARAGQTIDHVGAVTVIDDASDQGQKDEQNQ